MKLETKIKLIFGWMISLILTGCLAAEAGRRYSRNPELVSYRKQEIILTPGDVACPAGHVCQWKAWDLNEDKEVGANNRVIGCVNCTEPIQ